MKFIINTFDTAGYAAERLEFTTLSSARDAYNQFTAKGVKVKIKAIKSVEITLDLDDLREVFKEDRIDTPTLLQAQELERSIDAFFDGIQSYANDQPEEELREQYNCDMHHELDCELSFIVQNQ